MRHSCPAQDTLSYCVTAAHMARPLGLVSAAEVARQSGGEARTGGKRCTDAHPDEHDPARVLATAQRACTQSDEGLSKRTVRQGSALQLTR